MTSLRLGFITLVVWLLLPGIALADDQPNAAQILDRVDDLYRGKSAQGKMTMKVVNPHYRRTISMDFWSRGKEKSMVRIVRPRKERRTATLKNGNNIWNYLPKVNRTIKIPSSMMGGSWMGSDFTNDDLVKEHRMAEDYHSKVSFRGKRDGQEVIDITCIPKPQAAVVWGKLVVTVRRADLIPLRILYYKENGQLGRTMTFSDIKELGGRKLPTKMRVVPHDKRGHETVVVYDEITFDVQLPARFFSVDNLRK